MISLTCIYPSLYVILVYLVVVFRSFTVYHDALAYVFTYGTYRLCGTLSFTFGLVYLAAICSKFRIVHYSILAAEIGQGGIGSDHGKNAIVFQVLHLTTEIVRQEKEYPCGEVSSQRYHWACGAMIWTRTMSWRAGVAFVPGLHSVCPPGGQTQIEYRRAIPRLGDFPVHHQAKRGGLDRQ